MKKALFAVVAAGLALGGCAEAFYERAGTDTIDTSYSVTGWRHLQGGAVTYVFAKVYPGPSGNTKICAAFADEKMDIYTARDAHRAHGQATLHHNGVKLVQGLDFMSNARNPKEPFGKTSNCVVTDVPWQDAFSEGDLDVYIH